MDYHHSVLTRLDGENQNPMPRSGNMPAPNPRLVSHVLALPEGASSWLHCCGVLHFHGPGLASTVV